MNASFTKKFHEGRRENKLKSNAIPQLFLNERLWCFCRFCVKYRQLNHDIVVRINRFHAFEKVSCQALLPGLAQPILGDICK
jgi:hypothetical protein